MSIRTTQEKLPATPVSDHGALTGLLDDDHTQYQKETDFTAGSVLFRGSSVITQDNPNFFWDDTNNRLGLGTTTPQGRLQSTANVSGGDYSLMFGQLELTLASTPEKRLTMGYNSTNDSGYIQAIHSNTAFKSLLLQPGGGNVGIGGLAGAPAYPLQIAGAAGGSVYESVAVENSGSGDGTGAAFVFRLGGFTYGSVRNYYSTALGGGVIALRPQGSTDGLTITPALNVGIGTTSPVYKLDIVSSGGGPIARFQDTGVGNSYLQVGNSAVLTTFGALDTASSYLFSLGNLLFYSGGVENMRLSSAGYLGIGTTPGVNLDVLGVGAVPNAYLRLKRGSSATDSVVITAPSGALSGATPQFSYGLAANTSYFSFQRYDGATATADMSISTGGNVGIGTVSPDGKLHVKGVADDQQLIVQGHSTQTSDLAQWKDNAGNVMVSVTGAGVLVVAPSGGFYSFFVNSSGQMFAPSWSDGNGTMSLGSGGSDGTQAVTFASLGLMKWTATGSIFTAADTGMGRNAAGVVEINNGTLGTLRDIKVRNAEIDGALNHDGTTVGFYGTAPATQATGWSTSNIPSPLRTFDYDTMTGDELIRFVATLVDDLKLTGIITS